MAPSALTTAFETFLGVLLGGGRIVDRLRPLRRLRESVTMGGYSELSNENDRDFPQRLAAAAVDVPSALPTVEVAAVIPRIRRWAVYRRGGRA